MPGCWYWSGGRYIGRRGYWITPHAGWVWVPSYYVWTPRGYIFSPGHWDYDLDSRGVLFAPAYFPAEVRVRVGFVFCPAVCVDLGILRLNLFAYPRYNHYCFGDYYDDAYLRVGIYPWFQCQTVHTWYDPLFVYDRWHFRQTDPHWARTQAREYQVRHGDRDLRPARTYAQVQAQVARAPVARRTERPLLVSVKTVAVSQSTPIKFERINSTERQEIAVRSTEVRNSREQRNRWEGPAARPAPAPSAAPERQPTVKPGKESKATKVAPRPEVRATRPEQVMVPNQSTTLRPSTSRYIEKQAPGPPNQEHDRTDTDSSRKPADKDSRRRK